MATLIFDIETDGLLDTMTTIHCIGIKDAETGQATAYNGDRIQTAIDRLCSADCIVGHNIIGFDIPAIINRYPEFKPQGVVRDTLVLSRLFWPHIKDKDYERENFPGKLIGSHSLKAWGYRLGEYKDEAPGFDVWSEELEAYMMQDVEVNYHLWEVCQKQSLKWDVPMTVRAFSGNDCVELEHQVAEICSDVERHGICFDSQRAINLTAKLTKRKAELTKELTKIFPTKEIRTPFTPKVNNKKRGYVKGVPTEKVTYQEFNPASRQQVAERLREIGWEPKEYSPSGHPKVDETVLSSLKFPEAAALNEYFLLTKRLGQISDGNQAWLRLAKGERIHGRIHSGGTHTGRMSHSNPNIAQVPSNRAPYGEECRACFIPDKGHVMVDADADALELRCLAAYMSYYDGGAYIKTVLEGNKEDGTDLHTLNAKAIGCDRDTAKVFFYGLIYGAGVAKLGEILGGGPAKGKAAKANLMRALPALNKLIEACQKKVKTRGYLVGLDGRRLVPRSEGAALNTLLQSAGALIMKRALVIFVEEYLTKGSHIVGIIHDEFLCTVPKEDAQETGENLVTSIRRAGEFYRFKCPLDAQYQVGANWSEIH